MAGNLLVLNLGPPPTTYYRQTEEAVCLAENSGRSDLIPDWCKAPDNISPPVPSPSRSEADPLEVLETLSVEASAPKRGKKE